MKDSPTEEKIVWQKANCVLPNQEDAGEEEEEEFEEGCGGLGIEIIEDYRGSMQAERGNRGPIKKETNDFDVKLSEGLKEGFITGLNEGGGDRKEEDMALSPSSVPEEREASRLGASMSKKGVENLSLEFDMLRFDHL